MCLPATRESIHNCVSVNPEPCTLHPTPYTLHPTPYTLHTTPCTLHPTPYTLHPIPYTLYPTPVCARMRVHSQMRFNTLRGMYMMHVRVDGEFVIVSQVNRRVSVGGEVFVGSHV